MAFKAFQCAVALVSIAALLQVTLQAAVSSAGKQFEDKTQLLNSSLTKYLLKHGYLTLTDELSMKRSRASEVPEGFEDQIVEWLVAEYGINVEDMSRLINGDPVCGKRNCTTLPSMGSVCCPFG